MKVENNVELSPRRHGHEVNSSMSYATANVRTALEDSLY